jgi:hypothetical protein
MVIMACGVAVALVLVIATRGRLGYRETQTFTANITMWPEGSNTAISRIP